jgi:cytoplasmic iron level regulating protein YaaA (DUF328/UPF0246 family)
VSASQPFVVLLPPSEGKAPGGTGAPWSLNGGLFGEALAAARREVVEALVQADGGDASMLGVSGLHLDRGRAANRSLLVGPTRPAAQRYTGVVFTHLSIGSLSRTARHRAAESLVVVSGLLGAVAIDDAVPDYRLKMGASLAPLGKLSSWWRPALSAALGEALAGSLVIDVLPLEHRSAVALPPSVERLRVGFVERSGAMAGHDAKAAKGSFVRHLLSSRGSVRSAIKRFDHPRFDVVVG